MDNSENSIEYKIEQKNRAYYDFLSKDSRSQNKKQNHDIKKRRAENKKKSFAKQEIHLSDLPLAVKGYESIFFTVYAVTIPYLFGLIFLSLVLSTNSSSNPFSGTDSFLIVWIVGYEVVSVLSLIWITLLFITHDSKVV